MKSECKTITTNNYILIAYSCSDGRLRYPTGVKNTENGILTDKVQNIIKAINNYATKHILISEKIIKSEIENHLDSKFRPDKIDRSVRDLVSDHKEMIEKMRTGKLLKKRIKTGYSEKSIEQYERMRERWEECAADSTSGFQLSYSMDIVMFRKFLVWLVKKNYSQNSMYNIVNNLGIFLKYTFDEAYHQNDVYKHREFSVPQEESDAIVLTYDELIKIYNHECDTPTQEEAKDFFVYGCFLALRFGDLNRINEYRLAGDVYEVQPTKSFKKVTIPCHWIGKEIYQKYNGKFRTFKRQSLAR
jgi:hypothetical protein